MTYTDVLGKALLLLLCSIETITETGDGLIVVGKNGKFWNLPATSTIIADFQTEIGAEYLATTSIQAGNRPLHINLKHIETVTTTGDNDVIDFVSGKSYYTPIADAVGTALLTVRGSDAATYVNADGRTVIYSLCNAAQSTCTTGDNYEVYGDSGTLRFLPKTTSLLTDLPNVACCAAGTTPPTTRAKIYAPIILFDEGNAVVGNATGGPVHSLPFDCLSSEKKSIVSSQWDIADMTNNLGSPPTFVSIASLPVFASTSGETTGSLTLNHDGTPTKQDYCLRLTVTDADGNTSEVRAFIHIQSNIIEIVISQGMFTTDTAGNVILTSDESYSIRYNSGVATTPLYNFDTYHLDTNQDGTADVSDTVIANITNTYTIGTTNSSFGTEDSSIGGGFQASFAQRLVVVVS
ncbi:MAG: hypothetical protein ACPG5B_06830 [Chitinophagales bacterium]